MAFCALTTGTVRHKPLQRVSFARYCRSVYPYPEGVLGEGVLASVQRHTRLSQRLGHRGELVLVLPPTPD